MKDYILLAVLYFVMSSAIRFIFQVPNFLLLSYIDRQIEFNQAHYIWDQGLENSAKIIVNPIFTLFFSLAVALLLAPIMIFYMVKRGNWFKRLSNNQIKNTIIYLTLISALFFVIRLIAHVKT